MREMLLNSRNLTKAVYVCVNEKMMHAKIWQRKGECCFEVVSVHKRGGVRPKTDCKANGTPNDNITKETNEMQEFHPRGLVVVKVLVIKIVPICCVPFVFLMEGEPR